MNIAFHTGVSGMTAYQEGLNLIANNVANTNTDGFKPQKETFRDLVNTNMDVHDREKLMYGHGVRTTGGDVIMRQGNMRATGNPLDFAIAGEGFFAVQNGNTVQYTRSGVMDISVEEDGNFLIATDGSYVLDGEGERITVPYKESEPKKDADGNIINNGGEPTTEVDFQALQDKLGIYTFVNPYGLTQNDGCKFSPSTISGAAVPLVDEQRANVDILSATLESSAVDMADEMVAIMQTQKAYQFSAKIVQTADQIEEIVNNLR